MARLAYRRRTLSTRLGLHLAPHRIRAVKLTGRSLRCDVFELDWDPEEPAAAASALRNQLGNASRVSMAVDMGFCFVKQVKLPPLPVEEKRRILALEPERYFPIRGEGMVVSLRDGNDLAFAVRERLLEQWISAMGILGPIELVEPAPYSLARALQSAEVSDAAVLLLPPYDESPALIELEAGKVLNARRLFGSPTEALAELADHGWSPPQSRFLSTSDAAVKTIAATWHDAEAELLPHIEHCPSEYTVAHGAALATDVSTDSALTTVELARRWAQRERRRLALAVSALVAAVVLLVFAIDGYRARAQHGIEEEIAALRDRGQAVLTLQGEAERVRGDLEALTDIIGGRMDPLEVLLTVTRLLPENAYLRTIQGSESEWRLEGYAADAANLIPIFEASPGFEEVRFVRATNRVRLGNENYEDFSLALRYVPQP